MTTIDIDKVKLSVGAHSNPEHGMCVMEAVAYVAGELFSDSPQCACPVIASYLRRLNDRLPNDLRQQLKVYIRALVGTRSTREVELKRAYMLVDFAARVVTPLAFEVIGAHCWADELRALSEVVDSETAAEAQMWLYFARDAAAYAAYAAAYAADAADAAAAADAADAAAAAAAYDAAYAAAYAADAADAAARRAFWEELTPLAMQLIERLIAVSA